MDTFYDKELKRIQNSWEKTMPERVNKFTDQYLAQGFSDENTWNLDFHLTNLILPRLKRFKELASGVIVIDFPLDDIIEAFELLSQEDDWDYSNKEEMENMWNKIEKGLKAFAENYRHLWW